MSRNPVEITKEVFETLKQELPHFSMEIDESPEFTDLELIIPKQNGLSFEVSLNLQNTDELHFNVDEFWGQWFPCTDSKVAQNYASAIHGFLLGQCRIEVYSRKGKSYKRLLQLPKGDRWRTEYTHTSIHWPCIKPQIRYVQNVTVT